MASRTCEEYNSQEDAKEHSYEDEVRRRKKNFQCEVVEGNAPEENGISNRLFSSTFILPLTRGDPFPETRPRHAAYDARAAIW